MARNDYSWSETALNFGAPLTLAAMAVMSFLLRYITDPVTCFTPAQFESMQVSYALQTCFQAQHIWSAVNEVSQLTL